MIYLKHPEHGILAVTHIEPVHEVNGWVPCDIYEEIAKKKPAPVSVVDMSKDELEKYARSLGVELDKRKSKTNMLLDLEDALK